MLLTRHFPSLVQHFFVRGGELHLSFGQSVQLSPILRSLLFVVSEVLTQRYTIFRFERSSFPNLGLLVLSLRYAVSCFVVHLLSCEYLGIGFAALGISFPELVYSIFHFPLACFDHVLETFNVDRICSLQLPR